MMAALEESQRLAREQEQRLAATYEHAAIGIAEIAPDGRFLRVNEAICAITGRTREDLLVRQTVPLHASATIPIPTAKAFRKQVAGELEFYSVEKRLMPPRRRDDLGVGALIAGAQCVERRIALRRARGAGHHRAQGAPSGGRSC